MESYNRLMKNKPQWENEFNSEKIKAYPVFEEFNAKNKNKPKLTLTEYLEMENITCESIVQNKNNLKVERDLLKKKNPEIVKQFWEFKEHFLSEQQINYFDNLTCINFLIQFTDKLDSDWALNNLDICATKTSISTPSNKIKLFLIFDAILEKYQKNDVIKEQINSFVAGIETNISPTLKTLEFIISFNYAKKALEKYWTENSNFHSFNVFWEFFNFYSKYTFKICSKENEFNKFIPKYCNEHNSARKICLQNEKIIQEQPSMQKQPPMAKGPIEPEID